MRLEHAVATAVAISLNGCTSFCSGAGCDEGFPSTIAVIHFSSTGNTDEIINPVDGYNSISGLESDGNGWAAALPFYEGSADGLILGIPAESRVVMVNHLREDDGDGTTTLQESVMKTLQSSITGSDFGTSVTYIPDMNGDGLAELAIGAPSETGGGTNSEAGAAYLFMGPTFSDDPASSSDIPKVRVISEAAYDHLGEVVEGCEDLDGDGLGDLLIASPRASPEERLSGEVGMLSSNQLATTAAEIQAGSLTSNWIGASGGDSLGSSLSCMSGTIAIGAPYASNDSYSNTGAVYLLKSPNLDSGSVDDIAWVTLTGVSDEQYFGSTLAMGDIDGDGAIEIAVGSPGHRDGRGLVSVYSLANIELGDTSPIWEIEGSVSGDRFGSHIEMADRNGDNIKDLWIGAPRANPSGLNLSFYSGVLYLFYGYSTVDGLDTVYANADDADITWHEAVGYRKLGSNFIAGDMNGDEAADLVVLLGAP